MFVYWRTILPLFFLALLTASLRAAANYPDTKRAAVAAEVLNVLQQRLSAATDASARGAVQAQIDEVNAALENNGRPSVPARVDIFLLPVTHYRYAAARVGMGHLPASNVQSNSPDPLPSSFWARPHSISEQDLAAGFGRAAAPTFNEEFWIYSGPKRSSGLHAGIEATANGRQIKIKFGEVNSEPFAARIFHALGFNAEAVDYTPGIKIRYDRRLFTEFNSRKPVDTKITALFLLPVWTIHFQPRHDPFQSIAKAILIDGSSIDGPELRRRLLRNGRFDEAVEEQIDHLVTVPANVQVKNKKEKNIGPWDFGQLDHAQRRELRGAGLLAAWLGWFDSRAENTRLKVVYGDDGRFELKHYFSDLGGGLGRSAGLISRKIEDPSAFPSAFTTPETRQGPGRMTRPFRIVDFRPIEKTPAFAEMTLEDAKWMASLINQLTEAQLWAGLRASGYEEATARVYLQKLLLRREKLTHDLDATSPQQLVGTACKTSTQCGIAR